MSHQSTTRKLKEACETLRVLCPTKYPVYVVRAQMGKDDYGDCTLTKIKGRRAFKIRLNRQLDIHFQFWILVHEWAHAMTWELTHARHDDHGAHFGIAYSEAYRAIYS